MGEEHTSSRVDGHRLTEFIYGTVVALVAVSGVDARRTGWVAAFVLLVLGGAAIWLAHAYSTLMSHRITSGRRITGVDIGNSLTGSWPIVSAALLMAVPIIGVGVGLYSMALALRLTSGIGVLILALVGAVAGVVTRETWPRRIALVLAASALGLLVVSIESAIHH